jgi:hypothetical protein
VLKDRDGLLRYSIVTSRNEMHGRYPSVHCIGVS